MEKDKIENNLDQLAIELKGWQMHPVCEYSIEMIDKIQSDIIKLKQQQHDNDSQ